MAWSVPKTWGYKETLSSSDLNTYVRDNLSFLKNTVYPVGSIYLSVVSTNPGTSLGFGTWVAFGLGQTLVAINAADADFNVAEKAGGAKTVNGIDHLHSGTTSVSNNNMNVTSDGSSQFAINIHGHNFTTSGADRSLAMSVVQPYITVYMFKRTA